MLSCSNEVGNVVEAIRLGAQDYLTKPFEKAELDVAMLKCQLEAGASGGKQGIARVLRYDLEDAGYCLPRVLRWCASGSRFFKIAPVDVPVFIYAESSVGKGSRCTH